MSTKDHSSPSVLRLPVTASPSQIMMKEAASKNLFFFINMVYFFFKVQGNGGICEGVQKEEQTYPFTGLEKSTYLP